MTALLGNGNFSLRIGSLWSRNRCSSHILVWLCISLCLSDHFINHPLLSHIHILCSFWTMKWNAYIFTNACYQCKWEKEAYYQSRLLWSPHLCTLTGNKHLFLSRTQNILSPAHNKKWRSCLTLVVIDGASHMTQTQCSGTLFKQASPLRAGSGYYFLTLLSFWR